MHRGIASNRQGSSLGSGMTLGSRAIDGSACACGRVTIARTSDGDEGHQRSRDLCGIVTAATLDPAAINLYLSAMYG